MVELTNKFQRAIKTGEFGRLKEIILRYYNFNEK